MNPEQRNILVIDEQISVSSSSKSVTNVFTKGSHNRNLTVIDLMQNVNNQGKIYRTISNTSHYNVVFRNRRNASQFRTMAYHICPSDGRWLVESFTDATSKPYGYLVMDHHVSTSNDQTVANNILPKEPLTYYLKNHSKFRRHLKFLIKNSKLKLNKRKVVKGTVKFLSIAPYSEVVKAVL